MLLFRKILFYLFILIYLIGCPIIILNALGIVFRPDQKEMIQSTGLISLATIPEGASVFINGEPHDQKSPTVIRNLPEGIYAVRVTLDQYHPWEKSVRVVKEQATALEDIILIPNNWPEDILSSRDVTQVFCRDDNPFIVLCRGTLLQDVYVYKMNDPIITSLKSGFQHSKEEPVRRLFPGGGAYNALRISSVLLMPKSPFALVLARQNDRNWYLWADLKSSGGSIVDVSHLFVGAVGEIFWQYEDSENIFYISEKDINRISVKENAVYPRIAGNVKSFGLFHKRLLVMSNDRQFEEIDYLNNTSKSLMGDWGRMPGVFETPTSLEMYIISEKLILFIDEVGKLLSNYLPYELIPSKVSGIGRASGDRILVWTKTQLGYVDFAEMKREGIFEAGPKIAWIVTDARDIQQAFWVNDGSHVLLQDKDRIELIELGSHAAGPSVFEVRKAQGAIVYSDPLGKVFFVDKDADNLISLTVIPEHGLVQFAAPDSINRKESL
ncbi:MAG: PEGA domain-containing protein [Candidatus Omnitrophica bacterium]|nr:PEGA domain-containing protein [Candidatus Omnitrophota bacterium]